MKKLISSIFLLSVLVANACIHVGIVSTITWYTISGINEPYNVSHLPGYQNPSDIYAAVPLTVYISKQLGTGAVDTIATMPVYAALQYRILPDGDWVTAVEYEDMDWTLEDSTRYVETKHTNSDGKTIKRGWHEAFPFFGQECLHLDVPDGTEVLIRVYFSDGVFENFPITGDYDDLPVGFFWGTVNFPDWEIDNIIKVTVQGQRPFR